MFGNNINNPFMMNNMYNPNLMGNVMIRNTPIMGNLMMRNTPMMGNSMIGGARTGGILSSLFGGGRGATSLGGIQKSFNFGSLLTNTSKALGVVKEAIPIVKEVGPMVGNMKQMLKIASIFKDETDIVTNTSQTNITHNTSSKPAVVSSEKENDTNIISTTTNQSNNQPNFFL